MSVKVAQLCLFLFQDKVQKMFQNAVTSQSADDKFTDWCTRTLQGLNASIDGRC